MWMNIIKSKASEEKGKRRKLPVASWALCCLVMSLPLTALAGGLGLGQTRVVYHEGDTSQSVTLHNAGDNVFLIQAVVSDLKENTPAPAFTVLPPVFRLEPEADSVVRIVRTGGDLPRDRESVFRLRVASIEGRKSELPAPSTGTNGVGGTVSLSLGFAIKVFYRPNGLSVTPEEAQGRLAFSRSGGRLLINNPTPYYLTFAALKVGGQKVDVSAGDGLQMVGPFAQTEYALPSGLKDNSVEWTLITDSGEQSPVQKGELK